MKKVIGLILAVGLTLGITACNKQETVNQPISGAGGATNGLLEDLAKSGVTRANTVKLIFSQSEKEFGVAIHSVVTDTHLIKMLWDSLDKAMPTGSTAVSPFYTVEFYNALDATTPLAKLKVNANDGSYVEGMNRATIDQAGKQISGLWHSHGLAKFTKDCLAQAPGKTAPPPTGG